MVRRSLRFGLAALWLCFWRQRAGDGANRRHGDPARPGPRPAGRAVSGAKVAVDVGGHRAGRARLPSTTTGGSLLRGPAARRRHDHRDRRRSFAEQRYTDVPLRVGQTLDLQVALAVAGVKESVTVAAHQRRHRRHHALGRRRGHHRARHRQAAAQRPQLPRAGAARSRQRAGAELRPHQDQLRARSRRPASSAAAATSPSTAWTTTTTWSAARC